MLTLARIGRFGKMIGAVALVVAVAVIVLLAITSQQAATDYARAVECGPYEQAGPDCYRDVAVRITSVSFTATTTTGGSPAGFYTINVTDGTSQWTAQVSQRLLPRPLTVGQQIEARVWRGNVTQLTASGWPARTYANPSDNFRGASWLLIVIVGSIVGGAIMVLVPTTVKRLRRS